MGQLKNLLRAALIHKKARGLDLDSAQATDVHAALIRQEPFRRALYNSYYDQMLAAHRRSTGDLFVEVGSGGGFIRERIDGAVTIDLRPGADVDLMASALQLPLADQSVGTIGMLNVLHHLPRPRVFFKEAARVLKPGGRMVILEPYASNLSRWIYRNLHHEPFVTDAALWELPEGGPMSSANGALPWSIFVRDRDLFENEFYSLRNESVVPHTDYMYIVSGGVSR